MGWRIWALLILTQACWSGSYVAMKFAGDAMPVGAVVVYRYGIVTLLYLLLIPFIGLPRLDKRDWMLVAILGAVNFALTPTLQVASLRYTRAADVSILIGLEPIITVVLAGLIYCEKLDRRTFSAMALGLLGVWVLSEPAAAGGGEARDRLWGNMLFLGSILCEAAVTVAGGSLSKRYPALSTIAPMKVVGFATACLIYAPLMGQANPLEFSALVWGALIYLGLLSSLFAYGAWYWVIRRQPISRIAPSLFAQPFIGAALGWLILDEVLGPRTWIGGALILAALAWTQMVAKAEPLPLTP